MKRGQTQVLPGGGDTAPTSPPLARARADRYLSVLGLRRDEFFETLDAVLTHHTEIPRAARSDETLRHTFAGERRAS